MRTTHDIALFVTNWQENPSEPNLNRNTAHFLLQYYMCAQLRAYLRVNAHNWLNEVINDIEIENKNETRF